jgi:hypothetical protein
VGDIGLDLDKAGSGEKESVKGGREHFGWCFGVINDECLRDVLAFERVFEMC